MTVSTASRLVPPESSMEMPFSRTSLNFADRASALSDEMNWGLIFPAPPWMTMAYAGLSCPLITWRLNRDNNTIRDVFIKIAFTALQGNKLNRSSA
jgi:hypothetical protein